MSGYGLTDNGFVAPRTADFLPIVEARIEESLADAGVTAEIDFERDLVWGTIRNVIAACLGDLGEVIQAVYDAGEPANAAGVHLDAIASIAGVTREPAERSRITLTLGTAGAVPVVVPAGAVVEGGGDDDTARWVTVADATIPASSTADVEAVATEYGPIDAGVGAVDAIVTSIAGWDTVTNAAGPSIGNHAETDGALRVRRAAELAGGDRSLHVIREAVLAVDGVDGAVVRDNPTAAPVTDGALTIDPYAIAVVVAPSTLTASQEAALARALYDHVAGVALSGSEVGTVTGLDGYAKTIRWSYATDAACAFAATLTLDAGYVLADVAAALEAEFEALVASLAIGEDVRRLAVYAAAARVPGILSIAFTLAGAGVDFVVASTERATVGTVTIS